MKLNLGCGFRHLDGYVNVDSSPLCEPDQVVDLEQTPWPFPSDSVTDIVLHHVLEHLGATTESFLAIVGELYRVGAPDCAIHITVPHPRHDEFLADPTHVRAILPQTFELFDMALNLAWKRNGLSNTPLALQLGVDLVISGVRLGLDPYWETQRLEGKLDGAFLKRLIDGQTNVVKEIQFQLRVVKPARRE